MALLIVIFIFICIFIFLLCKFPIFRVVGGILALVIAITISNSNAKFKESKSLIPANQIEISNLNLKKLDDGNYYLTGEVKNNSAYELQEITFAVKAYDCPRSTIMSDCVVVGEDDNASAYNLDVPPGQVRSPNYGVSVRLDNMPQIRGNFLWSYDVVQTIAKN